MAVFGFVPVQRRSAFGLFIVVLEVGFHLFKLFTGILAASFISGAVRRLVHGVGSITFHVLSLRVIGLPVCVLDGGIHILSDTFPCQTAYDSPGDQSNGGTDRSADGTDGGPGGRTACGADSSANGMRSGRSGEGITIGVVAILFGWLLFRFFGHVVISFLVVGFPMKDLLHFTGVTLGRAGGKAIGDTPGGIDECSF